MISRTGFEVAATAAADAGDRTVDTVLDWTFGAGRPISLEEPIDRVFNTRLALRINFENIGDLLSPPAAEGVFELGVAIAWKL